MFSYHIIFYSFLVDSIRKPEDSSTSSCSSSQDKNIVEKTKDKPEHTGRTLDEATNSTFKVSNKKYKQNTKDDITEKSSYDRHRAKCDDEKLLVKSKDSRKHKLIEHKNESEHHKHAKRKK